MKPLKTAARILISLFSALVIVEGWCLSCLSHWGPAIGNILALLAIGALTMVFYWAATEIRVQFALVLFSSLVISIEVGLWYMRSRP